MPTHKGACICTHAGDEELFPDNFTVQDSKVSVSIDAHTHPRCGKYNLLLSAVTQHPNSVGWGETRECSCSPGNADIPADSLINLNVCLICSFLTVTW